MRYKAILFTPLQDRAVTQWSGPVQRLNVKSRSRVYDEKQKFIGDPSVGMTSIARALARKCSKVQNPVWISHVRWRPDLKKVGETPLWCMVGVMGIRGNSDQVMIFPYHSPLNS